MPVLVYDLVCIQEASSAKRKAPFCSGLALSSDMRPGAFLWARTVLVGLLQHLPWDSCWALLPLAHAHGLQEETALCCEAWNIMEPDWRAHVDFSV